MRRGAEGEEELGAVRVGPRVGHRQQPRRVVCQRQAPRLVLEALAVDGAAAGAVAVGEVAALRHEPGDDAVEGAARVAAALGAAPAQLHEVLHRARARPPVQLHFHAMQPPLRRRISHLSAVVPAVLTRPVAIAAHAHVQEARVRGRGVDVVVGASATHAGQQRAPGLPRALLLKVHHHHLALLPVLRLLVLNLPEGVRRVAAEAAQVALQHGRPVRARERQPGGRHHAADPARRCVRRPRHAHAHLHLVLIPAHALHRRLHRRHHAPAPLRCGAARCVACRAAASR
mmetsp:Transcript_4748/g.17048  ORF Transcript_4748/g.17048 Transcript_4748/m.17048 type:complete len:287 (-) Transcript_4748:89-949(-)